MIDYVNCGRVVTKGLTVMGSDGAGGGSGKGINELGARWLWWGWGWGQRD